MVAVVTGNTLGLVAGSAGVLGGNGQLGSAATGRGGDVAFVNASTGNLTIQRQDELLIGLGPDIGIVRTYNSKGTFDFDNNDNWQISLYRRVFGLTGGTGVNTAGSTIKRTGADGAELTYSYDATLLKYVNKDGAGSYDTLTYNNGTDKWTWVDGDSRTTETFELQVAGTYRIKTVTDTDLNTLTYSYNAASLITSVLNSGTSERTDLIYNTDPLKSTQLTQINVVSGANTITRVRYTYDNNIPVARLSTVTTDLTLGTDNSTADGKIYTTTYTYDGTSNQIASITNTDGTKTSFTYETSGLFRVLSVSDYASSSSTPSNITNLAYTATTATLTTTDNNSVSRVSTITYSTAANSSIGLITRIQGPATSGQDINYLYDVNGNVSQMTDSRGNITNYTYDANGNQLAQQDAAGNTITRTYSVTNQLLTEVAYAGIDTNLTNAIQAPVTLAVEATLPQTTRYAYDAEDHLRFIVSPEGRVTEYRYNANGTRAAAMQYTNNLFSGTADEATLNTWVTTTVSDKTKSQRTDYTYDVRGQLSTRTTYNAVASTGLGVVDSNTSTTQYVYDQAGNLTQVIDARGVATTGIASDFVTSYAYDGLNRLTSQTDALGNVTSTIYNDSSTATTTNSATGTAVIGMNSVAVKLANGLVTINSYDLAGRLVSSTNTSTTSAVLGSTSYLYNKLGQLVRSTDATAQNTYYIYDTLGRKVGMIDPQLALTEYVYNNNNQVVRIVQYTAAVTATLNDTTALTNIMTTTGIRVSTPATDRVNRNLYDKAGRLAKQIDAMGAVTEYQYDGASRLVKTIGYANPLTGTQLTALAALTTEPLATDANTIPVVDAANDRVVRQLYSSDGLLLGKLDAEGYFSSYSYDAASRNTSITRYRNGAQLFGTATLDSGVPTVVTTAPTTGNVLYVVSDAANDQTSYNLYNARGQLEGTVDVLGYLTEFQYDTVGNRTNTIRYNTSITYSVGASVAASRPTANAEDQSTVTTYDANNRISSNTSNPDGLITNYTYDAVGNLTQQVRTYTGATALDNRSQFKQYDQLGRVTRELSGEGVLALQALVAPTQPQIDDIWDRYGTRYSYDLAGRVIVAIAANGNNAAGNKSLYYYDTEGKLKYQVNAVGEVTEFIYSKFDQRIATRQYKTRLVAATLSSMQTVAATATTGVVSTTVNTAANTALTALNTGVASYTETLIAYDNAGRAITLTDALLNVNSRTYNAFGELFTATNKIDASNNLITSYSYDKRGMVKTTTEDSAGINRITAAIYDAFGRITQTTDGRGGIVKRSYDRLGREVSVLDANSNAAALTANNSFTTYDAFSRVVTRRDSRGVTSNYDTVSYSYDSTARSMTMTTGEGVSVVTTRNRFGETVTVTDGRLNNTTYTYNADGQLKTTTTATGTAASPTSSITTINYDYAGKALNTVDARLTQTSFTYDAANRVLSRSVDPAGLNLTTQYRYDALGRQIWVKDAKNVWTQTVYDNKGQVTDIVVDPTTIPVTDAAGNITSTAANATGLNITTKFTYDARGKRLTVVEGFGSAQPKTTAYTYDKLGRLTQTAIDPAGLNLRTNYTYDKNDNVVLKADANTNKTVYTYDANNRLIYTVDALGNTSKNDYDKDGNVLTTTAYGAATTTATLAILANLQTNPTSTAIPVVVDATNRITSNIYDKDNRRTFSIDALGIVTGYTYDENGNQLTVTEAVGIAGKERITYQAFDAANRKISATDALGNKIETTYDAAGNIVTVKDALDNIGYFYYDAAGRMTLQVNPAGPQGTINYAVTELKYDAMGNQTDIIRYANVITSTPVVGTLPTLSPNADFDQLQKVSYDAAGRKSTIKTAFANSGGQALDASNSYTESFGYDALGNVLTSVARNGASTSYTYDVLNRKVTETLPITARNAADNANISVVNRFSYDALGNLTAKIEAEGALSSRTTNYTYTLNNQQASESVNVYLNTTQTSVATTKTKTYDVRGNVTSETDANNKITYHYYDLQNRKTAMVDASSVMTAFVYDEVGNKSSQTTYKAPVTGQTVTNKPTPTQDAANDRSMFYTYDAVGRETASEVRNMVVGTVSASNTYNALTTANLGKQTVYDGNGNVFRMIDANGNVTRAYYRKSGEKIAEVDAAGYLTRWGYDVYGNLTIEYKFAKKPSEASTPLVVTDATTITEILTVVDLLLVNDANVRTTTKTYDRSNRVITESRANVAQGTLNSSNGLLTQSTAAVTVSYAYNGLNNVIQKTDATGAITSWVYDNIGRETNQSDPVFTDNTGNTLARKRTDKEYDGLNNLKRTLVRGTNDAVETDDQITTYTYSSGGRLTTETQLMGATNTTSIVTQYEYDNTGNIVKRTLKDRQTAEQAINGITDVNLVADDINIYTYDSLNRQLSSSTKSTAETSYTFNQVQYNSFGEVINKRTYTNTTGTLSVASTWDEFAEYDQAGRVFKTNSEDGVVKVMAYDANDNVTIRITSTDNSNSISATQNTAASLNSLLAIPNTLRTMSVYDSRNQLTATLQASMDSTRTVAAVITNTNSEIANAPANPLTGSVTASQAAANPIAMGSARIGTGSATWSYGFSGVSTSQTRTANVTVTIPANMSLTGGNMRVDVYMTSVGSNTVNGYSYGFIAAGSSTVTIALAAANGSMMPDDGDAYTPRTYFNPSATSFRLIVSDVNSVKFTDQTWLPVSTQVWVPTYTTGTGAYVTTVAAHWETQNIMPTSGASAVPKRLYFTGQPYTPGNTAVSSSKFLLSYRLAGSTGAFTTVVAPQLATTLAAPNNLVPDTFAFDYSALATGNYEFNYIALDTAGNILNQQSGTFNTTTATPTISAQTPIAKGGIGYARLDNTGINLINQGSNASSVTMRYRVAGTTNWLTMASSFVKGTATTGMGIDSFKLSSASLAGLANGTSYEVSYEIYNSSNNLLRIASSYIVKDAAGNLSIKDGVGNANSANPSALSLIKVRLGNQAVGTAYIDLTTRPLGSTSAYLPLTRIYVNNLGQFDFSIIGMTGNQDIDMRAYNASNEYINHNQAGIYFNQAANVVTVLSVSSLPIPQTIVVKPPQTSSDTVNPAVSSVTGSVTSALAIANPIALGNTGLGVGVSWSANFTGVSTSQTRTANVTVTIPSNMNLTGSNIRVDVYMTSVGSNTVNGYSYGFIAAGSSTVTISLAAANGSMMPDDGNAYTPRTYFNPSVTSFRLVVSDGNAAKFVDQTWASQASGTSVIPPRLNITGQPPATTTVYLSYRSAGSTGAYSLVGVPQMLNISGAAVPGNFLFDYSTIPAGNYEYQYAALDAAGNLLNQQSGTFNTSNPAAPTVSAQTPIATGSIGRSFVDQYAIRLLNQGSNAASVNMRYRVAGTSYWSAPVALTRNSLGIDSFYLAAASFGLFANSTTYEVDYEVVNTGGSVLRVVSNQIVKDAAGNISLRDGLGNAANAASLALSLTKIRLGGQPAATAYIDWGSRPVGSTAAYTPGTRIYPNSYGKFDLSIVGMPVGTNQELDINAYNAAGLLINRSQADLYINQPANVVTVLAQRAINIPQISVSNADYVVLGYRLKNSNANYTMLPAKQLALVNGVKEVRIELPLTLANGDYEYQYTSYTAEALNPNAQGSLFVEDFSGPTNKLTKYSDPDNLVVVSDQGTNFGSVTMSTGSAAVTSYPALLSPNYTYTAGSLFHAEVTTNELSTAKWALVGIQGANAAGQFMRHGLMIDGNNLYARTDDGAGLTASNLLTTNAKANTTYVVEVETTATGTKLYVFEQGKTRAEGWSETRNAGAWANMYIALYSLQMAGRGTSSVTIDNIGLINNPASTGAQTALGGSNGTFTIGVGTTTANTRLDWALSTSSTVASIQRKQSYNAFGEIISETDGNANVTSFTYNTLGKLTQKTDASVSVTAENGTKQTINPVTSYTYDAIGRMIATTDANNNINTQAWLAGSDNNEQILFERHADGGFIKRSFDVFGNKVSETDRINSLVDTTGRTTTYGYDKANQLTQITRPTGATDRYYYDAAGQRIIHANALTVYANPLTGVLDANSAVEKTNYDSLGRITDTKTNLNFATSYSYVYTTAVIGLGGATVSGWIKTTTDALGRTIVDKTDMFNRTFSHKDLGDNLFTYNYNRAGWLTSQTGTTGQNIAYDHYANGYIKSIHDKSLGMFTYYEYDGNGNRRYEGYAALKDKTNAAAGFSEFYQQATIAYDRLNRMTSVTDPKAKIEYEYDAVGNRRKVKSVYHDGVNGSLQVQEYWYKYDSMNRFLITMGTFSGGVITKGTGPTGADIQYNVAGQRIKATNAVDNSIEDYTYNVDGYLTNIHINGTLRSTRTNDLLGRTTNLTEYAANGSTVSYSQTTAYDKDSRTLSQVDNLTGATTNYYYYYDTTDNTVVGDHYSATGAGELALTYSDSNGAGAGGTLVNTIYGYEYFDDAKIAAIVSDPYNKISKKNNRYWKNGYTDITFDVNGHIDAAVDRVGKRNIRYITDAQGLILLRDEITGTIDRPNYRYFASTYTPGSIANKVQRYYYVDGKRVGDVGNDGPSRTDYVTSMANRSSQTGNYANWRPVGSADFDQNYEPISPTNPGPVASSYTVKNGDTLQSIALTVWGDSAMWYLIADANGLISGSTLSTNMALIIPNKVTNIHNNAGTFRPYNPGEAIGDLNPTIPAMPKPPRKKSCGGFFSIIAAVVSVAVSFLLPPGVNLLVRAALANIAGQVTGIALGSQKGFSFTSLATSVVGAGIGQLAPVQNAISGFSDVLKPVLGNFAATASQAVVGSIINQGVGNLTGAQKGFSWSSVAISGIGAVAGAAISDKLGLGYYENTSLLSNTTVGADIGRAAVQAGANALTKLVVRGGKVDWLQVATDTITGSIQNRQQSIRQDTAIAKFVEENPFSPEVNKALLTQNFGEAGHYSTMSTVLYLAGFSAEDAKAISLAAWGPDTDKRNAMTKSNFIEGEFGKKGSQVTNHLLDGEKDPKKVIADQKELAKQVGDILRDIKLNENDATFKLEYLSRLDVQNTLHRFGDAFAHVKKDGTRYSPGLGHAWDSLFGADPDNPNTNPDAYKSYVKTLFSVASGVSGMPRVSTDFVNDLANKVTLTTASSRGWRNVSDELAQREVLYDAIGSVTRAQASDMIVSPVKEDNFRRFGAGEQVKPALQIIYDIPGGKKIQ